MQDFRKLSVRQMARRLTKSIYQLTADFPGSEEFGPKAQVRRASVSICTNVAEGGGRRGDREFRAFVDVAMGSACELECETILSFDRAFITEATQEHILDPLIEIKRMLSGLATTLTTSIQKHRPLRRKDRPAPTLPPGEPESREPKADS
jgi:four helix bundle protein